MFHLDTGVCVAFLRGTMPSVLGMLRTLQPHEVSISAVAQAELRLGVLKNTRAKNLATQVELFLAPFECVPFDAVCAAEYARIRSALEQKGVLLGSNDLMIAATALAHDAVLVTSNSRRFEKVRGLKVETWAEVRL